ncbi:flagellar hook-associated protein FlgK [Clostridium butyricum]|uniref:flagellar hook-associated protein FlgK n=1 Tax=Clostridium butyricum TaxID=1492 RepID=UPI00210408D0|nr:flagellar hook-associated protein FlgK [Clostridium butyricum]MCQ2018573.1 flagellar hook-associated protein FlgK [Clostridium butyricum]UTY52195.1 flagellar hook-associated protein FlgK [Clostridium butyricum]
MAGLFDTFTVATRGINVQQGAINTTAHNIANANTVGYSRQRAVIETTRPFGGMSKFDSCGPGQIGTGAQITSIMRVRDSFIDYQVRNETSKLGNYQVTSDFLSQIEDVFGEPSDSGIQTLFSEFYSSFQELAKTPDKTSARTVALQRASALADALNHTYTQLEKKMTDAQELLQQNVTDINSMLDQINDLNQQISQVCAVGQTPNDLMDKRDNLLDSLSSMFGITIEKDARETINLKVEGFPSHGTSIDNLVNSKPNTDYTRFSYVKGVEYAKNPDGTVDTSKLEVEYYPLGDSTSVPKKITISGTADELKDLKGSLEQNRILIADEEGIVGTPDPVTGDTTMSVADLKKATFKMYQYDKNVNNVDPKDIKGEVAGNQSAQDLIKGYMSELDKMAAALAYSVNAIQTGSDGSGKILVDSNGNAFECIFVNGDGSTSDDGVNAKNITVNKNLINDVSKLNCGSTNDAGEKNGDRAQAIADLLTTKINLSELSDVNELDRKKFFDKSGISLDTAGISVEGSKDGKTVHSYYKDMISQLGTKAQEANRKVANQSDVILKNIKLQRLSVSGVSIDEEMTNLIQFQHSYSANAKMISTIDELLDVVINGLKR